jgi:hypothetical protein
LIDITDIREIKKLIGNCISPLLKKNLHLWERVKNYFTFLLKITINRVSFQTVCSQTQRWPRQMITLSQDASSVGTSLALWVNLNCYPSPSCGFHCNDPCTCGPTAGTFPSLTISCLPCTLSSLAQKKNFQHCRIPTSILSSLALRLPDTCHVSLDMILVPLWLLPLPQLDFLVCFSNSCVLGFVLNLPKHRIYLHLHWVLLDPFWEWKWSWWRKWSNPCLLLHE